MRYSNAQGRELLNKKPKKSREGNKLTEYNGFAKILVGIDPGSFTGVAFWHRAAKLLEVREFSSHAEAMLILTGQIQTFGADTFRFIIEDARKARKRPDLAETNTGKAQGVGYVKAYSKDWEAFCKLLAVPYELRPPSNTKTSPEYFESLTGLKTTKNQSHCRDAAMLVYGR